MTPPNIDLDFLYPYQVYFHLSIICILILLILKLVHYLFLDILSIILRISLNICSYFFSYLYRFLALLGFFVVFISILIARYNLNFAISTAKSIFDYLYHILVNASY